MEYRIDSMRHSGQGFQIALVTSFYDQKQYQLHNRWGSWFIGDPGERGGREPATISRSLVFDLQDYLHGSKGNNVKAAPAKPNPFIAKAKKSLSNENPFVKKAIQKTNPFIAKATRAT